MNDQDVPQPSTITVTGVPASVSFEQVQQAVRLLGIDPANVAEMSFTTSAVHVEVFSDGKPRTPGHRWTHDGKNIATHRLTIPVT
ncbi:hypothetical protein [Actinoallomurus iriomotensis]|uniref:Uncharacterized protein n=1 Tax=Actinoallomurus iriomotensis TaxID=478107 RepID=A0A9W6VVJ5_9ACTN|nr:hypothetical protein [Actinoallomurus iriomotensis]GLY81860.1 hypothetical protein Airi01_101270 [Actinoallomurus iriomotensis]